VGGAVATTASAVTSRSGGPLRLGSLKRSIQR
jgi:hypothetical protein